MPTGFTVRGTILRINTLARSNRAIFMREENEGGGGGAPAPAPAPDQTKFKAITSQEDFDRAVQDRVRRAEAKFKDYDTIKAKADQYDILARESQTDREREIEEARLEAFNEAMGKAVPRAVRAEFKSAAKGLMSDEALQSLLEDLDLTRYATDDGDPDEAKIAKKIAALAPAKGPRHDGRAPTGFGQGSRQDSQLRKGEAGLLEAQRRFGQKTAPSS